MIKGLIFVKHRSILTRLTALLLCLVTAFTFCGCGQDAESTQTQTFAMNTVITLTAYGKNREAGLDAAKSVIFSMDAMLDPQIETSVVAAMNRANGASTVVPGQIARMIEVAQEVYKRSDGALDPTIYPLVQLWGFVDQKYYVPSDEEIAQAKRKLCFGDVTLTSFPATGTYTVTMPDYARMTFGAIGKGCAAQYVIDAMRNAGVKSGLISLGGNLQTLGLKPGRNPWTVAITDPNDPTSWVGTIQTGIEDGTVAVVTSGPYQQNFTKNNKFYHHILSPKTGYPTTNSLVSVTIICEDGTTADALSTAMFVLGKNAALNYWRNYGGFEMILITNDNEITCTRGLMENFTLSNKNYTVRYVE